MRAVARQIQTSNGTHLRERESFSVSVRQRGSTIHSRVRVLGEIQFCCSILECMRGLNAGKPSDARLWRLNTYWPAYHHKPHVSEQPLELFCIFMWNYLFLCKNDQLHARILQKCALFVNTNSHTFATQPIAHSFHTTVLTVKRNHFSHHRGSTVCQSFKVLQQSKCKSVSIVSQGKGQCPGSGRLLAGLNIWALVLKCHLIVSYIWKIQTCQKVTWQVALNEDFAPSSSLNYEHTGF